MVPVDLAMAPIRTGGIAIRMHPRAAMYERISAPLALLLDKTRWKYTFELNILINRNNVLAQVLTKSIIIVYILARGSHRTSEEAYSQHNTILVQV